MKIVTMKKTMKKREMVKIKIKRRKIRNNALFTEC
jgi:hypothetical protein